MQKRNFIEKNPKQQVILVDQDNKEIGIEEKIKAHKEGKLHRAFSVCVFNSQGKLLLQKRAEGKYHSAGLWTNTCCSHPRPGETAEQAAHRRLKEEMGFDCKLKEAFVFIYQFKFDNGLTEYEYDHVFLGKYDGSITPDSKEVADWKWIMPEKLKRDIQKHPENYTYWFKISIDRIISLLKNRN